MNGGWLHLIFERRTSAASIPNPRGDITVAFRRNASIEQYTINLPHGVGGRFKRGTIEQALVGGRTEIQVPVASVDNE